LHNPTENEISKSLPQIETFMQPFFFTRIGGKRKKYGFSFFGYLAISSGTLRRKEVFS